MMGKIFCPKAPTEVVYALSPAAKRKVERPYHWLQDDHLVKTCVPEGITKLDQARQLLDEELHQYNLALIQFWYQEKIVGEQQVKAEDLTKVHF